MENKYNKVPYLLIGLIVFLFTYNICMFLETGIKVLPVVNSNIKDDISYEYLKSVTVYIKNYYKKCIDISTEEKKGEYCRDKIIVGTGIVVSIKKGYTYILTNKHIVENLNCVIFVKNGEKEFPAEIVKCHKGLDLAIIKVEGILKNKSSIRGIFQIKIKEKVYAVGNHLANAFIYSEGVMAGYRNKNLLFQLSIAPGNSGSGVFNKNGELVGLIYALPVVNKGFLSNPVFTHAIAIDPISIKIFLKELNLL